MPSKARPRIDRDDVVMTTNQTADYVHRSTDFVYRLAAAGLGPPRHRNGGRYFYLRSEVDAWLLSDPDLSGVSGRARTARQTPTNGDSAH